MFQSLSYGLPGKACIDTPAIIQPMRRPILNPIDYHDTRKKSRQNPVYWNASPKCRGKETLYERHRHIRIYFAERCAESINFKESILALVT